MKPSTGRQAAVIQIYGPDRKGLVAEISGFLYKFGANILDADQHTDAPAGMFFQRIRFELDGPAGKLKRLEKSMRPLLIKLRMKAQIIAGHRKKRMAVLVSKLDHCLMDIVLRVRSGELHGDLVFVAGNHRDHEKMVLSFGFPYYYFPVTPKTRAEQEKKLLKLLRKEKIELVVLARYMQILGKEFIEAFPNRIINIHHSFLPAFSGAKPYHRAYERGVKLIGATSHYVTEELDAGPIIEQETVRVSHRDSIEDLVRRGRDLEKMVLARAVRDHLEDRVLVYANKTVVF